MKSNNKTINDLTNLGIDIILNNFIDSLDLGNIKGGDVECEP